jgi:parallel beta-helix repeat protein
MTIGGTQAGQANTISGNLTAGVYLAGSKTTGAIITGNFLGTDPTGSQRVIRGDGSSPLADLQKTGVVVVDAGANTIGPLNVVSGNYVGVMLAGAGQTTVTSNRIGVAADGNSPLGNIVGIYINRSSNNTVVRNTISANTQTGVEIFGASTGNVVAGNIIGLGADGRTPLRTGGAFIQQTGVFVLDASGNTIGGSSAAAANTISGNAQSGVFIQSRNARARNNLLARNLIGPVTGGTTGPGNGLYGVVLYNAPENRVVQTGPDANRFFRNPGGNVRDFRGPNAAGAMAIARVRTRRTARR